MGSQTYSDVDDPVDVVVNCVVAEALHVVIVVQDAEVEVIMLLEEPEEAKDVERMIVSEHDCTGVAEHDEELELELVVEDDAGRIRQYQSSYALIHDGTCSCSTRTAK